MAARIVGVLLALLASACSVLSTNKPDPKLAQERADRLFPGQLTVLETVAQPFLDDVGPLIRYAVKDDPDAFVEMVDTGTEEEKDKKLRNAVETGRGQAAEMRVLTKVFEECGLPIKGIGQIGPYPSDVLQVRVYLAAPVTNATVETTVNTLNRCVETWKERRAASDSPWRAYKPHLTINITGDAKPPAVAGPTYARLTSPDVIAVVSKDVRYETSITDERSVGDMLRPSMSYEDGQKFDTKITAIGTDWLAKSDLNPKPRLGKYLALGTRFESNTVDRLRVYVSLCYNDKRPCTDEAAIAFTYNQSTDATDKFTFIRNIRGTDNLYHYPFEPR